MSRLCPAWTWLVVEGSVHRASSSSSRLYLCHPAPVPAGSVVGEAALPSSPRRCWADTLLLLLPRHARAHIASSAVACCCCCCLAPSRAQPPLCSPSGACHPPPACCSSHCAEGGSLLLLLLPPSFAEGRVMCMALLSSSARGFPSLGGTAVSGGTGACMAGLNPLSPFFILCLILFFFLFGHH